MIDIDASEITKSDLKDFIRDHREEVDELQDVSLSQNKDPLIKSVEEALESHLRGLAEVPKDGIITDVPTLSASEIDVSGSSAGVEDIAGGEDTDSEGTTDATEDDTSGSGDAGDTADSSTEDGSGEDDSSGDDTSGDVGGGLRPLSDHRV